MATVAGETQFTAISAFLASAHVKSGKLRALAIGREDRDPAFPDLPTLAEAGYPSIKASTWMALLAPAGTPRAIVERLNAEIAKIIRDSEFIARLRQQGAVPGGGSPEALGSLIEREIENWRVVVRENKITAEP
jgi:tripartite-type tricarboxylate transporter receptor subunit TctC